METHIRGLRHALGPVLFSSLHRYRRGWATADALAAVTLLVIAVPEQLATSRLAEMPPITGLYAFIAGTVVFALFGSNPQMSVGADSTIAPLFAIGIGTLAQSGSGNYAELVALLAVVVGLMVVLVGLFRLGGVVSDTETPSQPVFGAAVTYTRTGGSTAGGTTTTDVSGAYTFSGVSPGRYIVAVVDKGYIASAPETVTVGVGGMVSQGFVLQGDRDPLLQPFTSTSIWNMPIGSDAVYEPANLIPAAIHTLVSDQHVIVMTPTASPMTIVQNPAGAVGGSGQRCDTSGAFLTTAPIPADFYVASSTSNLRAGCRGRGRPDPDPG